MHLCSKIGEKMFFRTLMRLVERDQLKQIEAIIKSDPIISNSADPEELLDYYNSTAWFTRRFYNDRHPDYEWYIFPPFLQIAVMYKNRIDITTLSKPLSRVINQILDNARNKVGKLTFRDMNIFFDGIITDLLLYKENEGSYCYTSVPTPKIKSIIHVPEHAQMNNSLDSNMNPEFTDLSIIPMPTNTMLDTPIKKRKRGEKLTTLDTPRSQPSTFNQPSKSRSSSKGISKSDRQPRNTSSTTIYHSNRVVILLS